MALTLNLICGFETGGLEELSSTTGTPTISSSVLNAGGSERSLIVGNGANLGIVSLFSEVSSAGTDHVLGFAFRTDNITRGGLYVEAQDPASANHCRINVNTSGKLELLDSSSTVRITGTTTLSSNTWYYVELYWQNSNTGNAELFLNGISEGTASSQDFDTGAALDNIRIVSPNTADTVHYDDIYWLSGATAASDRLGHTFHVRGFQSGAATTTADYDIVTGGTGVSGNWANAGERPLNASNLVSIDGTYAITYNDTNSGGAGPGINSGSGSLPTADYQVVGAKWWWNIDRTSGAGRTHQTARGNTGDGATTDTGLNSVIDTTAINYFLVDEALDTPVPLVTEDFVQGFGQTSTSGQDTDCYEQMAMIAWVSEPTQPTLSALSDGHMGQQNSFHGPFEKS